MGWSDVARVRMARVRRPRRRPRDQRGAAAIEFAIIASLLLALVVGIVSYGYMLSFRQGVSQGAAEGARAAAVSAAALTPTAKADAARAAVNEALSSYGVSCTGTNLWRGGAVVGSCAVTVAACVNNTSAQCASVEIDYAYRDNPLVPSFPGLDVVLPSSLSYTAVAQVSS